MIDGESHINQQNLSPVIRNVVSVIEQHRDRKTLGETLPDFLQNAATVSIQEAGLSAYILRSHMKEDLSEENRVKLDDLISHAMENPTGALSEALDRISELERNMQHYFMTDRPFDYWVVTKVPDQLAMKVMELEAKRLAAERQAGMREGSPDCAEQIIVEGFVDEKTKRPGVWMSKTGVSFDPEKVDLWL